MLKAYKKQYYDWSELTKEVEKLSGKKTRDWAGKYSIQYDYSKGDFPAAQWAIKNGYDWRVLNDPVDEEGMKLRCEINTKWMETEEYELLDSVQYQDFWHYALDAIFPELSNDSYLRFCPKEALAEAKNEEPWVREILECYIKVFKMNNIPDEIEVHIWW
jgi:hypothetical protein